MSFLTCPTDVVEAAPEAVWAQLASAGAYERWADVRLRSGPARPLAAGDRMVFGTGPGSLLTVVFDVMEMDPPRRLVLDIQLPLGLFNHEVIQISAMGPSRCRVTYN